MQNCKKKYHMMQKEKKISFLELFNVFNDIGWIELNNNKFKQWFGPNLCPPWFLSNFTIIGGGEGGSGLGFIQKRVLIDGRGGGSYNKLVTRDFSFHPILILIMLFLQSFAKCTAKGRERTEKGWERWKVSEGKA